MSILEKISSCLQKNEIWSQFEMDKIE